MCIPSSLGPATLKYMLGELLVTMLQLLQKMVPFLVLFKINLFCNFIYFLIILPTHLESCITYGTAQWQPYIGGLSTCNLFAEST